MGKRKGKVERRYRQKHHLNEIMRKESEESTQKRIGKRRKVR
jgi:hypothetical protein